MKRLVLKESEKKVTGLCAGIADYAGVDVTVVRLIVIVLIILTNVLPGIFAYFIAATITPKEGEVK